MKKLIDAIIAKWFCLHQWIVESHVKHVEKSTDTLPRHQNWRYLCTKCGRVRHEES